MLWHKPEHGSGPDWVVEGKPVGQYYGLGGSWTAWQDLPEITAGLGEGSPARKVSKLSRVSQVRVGCRGSRSLR